jgi:hypothetical protein
VRDVYLKKFLRHSFFLRVVDVMREGVAAAFRGKSPSVTDRI